MQLSEKKLLLLQVGQDTHIISRNFWGHLIKTLGGVQSHTDRDLTFLCTSEKPRPMGSFSARVWWAVVTKMSALMTYVVDF